ncbi:MAG: type II secretion system protein GspC [Bdellovibrionota bacterium]
MKNLFQNLRIKIRGDKINLPEAKNIAPIVYIILAVVGGVSTIGTVFTFIKKEKTLEQATNIKKKKEELNQKKIASNAEFSAILKRNIFNLDGTLPDTGATVADVCTGDAQPSTLSYKVSGIIYGGDAKSSIALLEGNSDHQSSAYKLGDSLIPGTIISNISSNRVYLTSKSCPEYLEIHYPSLPAQGRSTQKKNTKGSYSENGFERIGNTTTVTKQWVNDVLTNKLSSALEEARAVPYLVGGQIKGFTISQIVPDSVYSKLGLQNGDVVSSINGIELNDAARAIQTLNSLRSESNIALEVTRGGQSITLKVDVQ